MRTLLAILTTVLISQYGAAQQGQPAPQGQAAQPGQAGGRGGGGGGGRGGGGGGRGQQAAEPPAPQNPGFECMERVETPEFPRTALQSHVDGTVYVWAKLTPQATVDNVQTQVASAWADGPKLLVPAVEKAVRASKFKSDCAGKTVAVVYRYELRGEPTANPKATTRTELNILFIDSAPESTTAKSAAPAK